MLTDECVSQERLTEYSLGLLSDEESSRIEEHLGACAACEGTLGQTDAAADSIIDAIRQPGLDDSASQDRWFRQAADRLKELDPSSSLGLERSSLTHLTLPLQLRDYELREKIGEGGMGVVYRAVHTRLNKEVAVKLLSSHRLREAGAVLRFQREMQAVGQLDHPSIVRATDAGEIDGTHFLVMEYVPGVDLGTLVRAGGPLSVADACALIRRAAEGLQHVHESEIVHRDVKPSNLLLSEAGDVKILDLGLARVEQVVETSSELTSLGQLMGTLEYMAPEQCDDSHQVDARADIYALGATLYKLLTGQTPFNGDGQRSPVGKLSAIANEPFPSVRDLRPDVPVELEDLLARMTVKDPEDRITSAAEVAASLESFAQGAEFSTLCAAAAMTRIAAAPNSHTPVSAGRKGGGRKRFWALLATALVALAAVIVFETDRGRIVITSQRDDLNVIVKRNDKLYDEWELTRGTNVWKIRSGHIEIILPAGNEDLRVTNNSFELTRNGKVEVTIERRPGEKKEAASGREYSYQAKTWDEWIEILEHEQSAEGLIDAVDAVGQLGRKENPKKSMHAVWALIRDRGVWDVEADTPEGKLNIALGRAVRRLLADETATSLRDVLTKGGAMQRFIILHHLIAPYGESSQQEGSRHFENLKAQYPVLLQGIEEASRDANVKTAQSALTILSLFGAETPVYRQRLERMLERKEPVELISGAAETIESKKDYDAWRLRALTQLIERLPISQEKKTWNDLEHHEAEAWFMGLARLGKTAAPAVPGLIRVVESKPRWIDETFTDTRFTRAKDLGGGRTIQRSSIRVSAILTLGAIGEQAEPALAAIRRLKTSKEEHLREAALAAEAAITGKPVDLPEPKTSSTKPASAPKVAGANFYFKAKTWNEWVEIAKREQSTEGLIDAVDAIGQLGRKEKPQESFTAVLELIRDRGMWSYNPASPEGKLCITLGGAIRALLSDETAPLIRDALKNGESLERFFLLKHLANIYSNGREQDSVRHFANLKKQYAVLEPGVDAASRDADVKAAGQALGMLAEYSLDTPLYRTRLERLLKEQEPSDLLMQAVRTVRDKKEYDAWTLQALTQLVERIPALPDKKMAEKWERMKVLDWLKELASLGDAAAPAVPGLIRIVEAKPGWVDQGFTAREYSNAYRSGNLPSTDARSAHNRKRIFVEGQLTTVRIATVLVLGHMGPNAQAALPAVRKLRISFANTLSESSLTGDVSKWIYQELYRAALQAEKSITGKPVEETKAPTTGTPESPRVSPNPTTVP